MSSQETIPNTDKVAASYTCGHGRTHQIPSDDVRVLRHGGAGFIAACSCGPEPLEEVHERPHRLGDHIILMGGKSYDPRFWLVIEELSDGWFSDPSSGTLGGNSSYAMRRAYRYREVRESVNE